MTPMRRLIVCIACSASAAVVAGAQEAPASETPESVVAVLEAKCYPCHGADMQKNGLRLDSLERAQLGGDSGKPALVPGDALAGELVRRIMLPREHEDAMPPAGKPELTPEETVAITRWISRGAAWPVGGATFPPAPGVATVSFATHIVPILEAACYKCHGAERQKGDLRLDSIESIQKGSENGAIFTVGKPEESQIYKLITLPPDHPDVMPGQGDPLTKEQTELIRQWILEGALFDAAPQAVIAEAPAEPQGPTLEQILASLAEGVSPAPAEALEAFGGWGALALPLDQKTPLLQIDFQRASTGVGDEQWNQLSALAAQVTWLNLAGTDVSDDDLAQVAKLTNLTKLHLERTQVSDVGLAHLASLPNLQYLNLYGTKVTDAGLEHLKQLPALQKLYLWQTEVTKEGAATLASAKPSLLVDLGWEAPPPAETEATAAAYDEGSCCATAAAGGTECDHPCCVEARAAGKVCEKCNPTTAAAAVAPAADATVAAYDEGSCCATAAAGGTECDHPCCVEARAAGKICKKCNPEAA